MAEDEKTEGQEPQAPAEADAPAEAEAPEEAAAEAAEQPEPAADQPSAAEPAADEPAAKPAAPAPEEAKPAAPRRTRAERRIRADKRAAAKARARAEKKRTGERKAVVPPPKQEHPRVRSKERRGVVVSSAMDKTIVVRVDNLRPHPAYKKVVRRSTKFRAHDEGNAASVGDVVRIAETRPLSKTKRWRLVEVLEEAR